MSKSDEKRDRVLGRLLRTPPKPRVVHRGKNTADKIKDELDRLDQTGDRDLSKLADLLGQNADNPDITKKRRD